MYNGMPVDDGLLRPGDRVVLFQDDDDFEVEAKIDFTFVRDLDRDSWIATPDWSTKKAIRKPVAFRT